MNVREKLAELLKKADKEALPAAELGKPYNATEVMGRTADHLIANGVTGQEWISGTERLPGREKKLEPWKKYNVVVLRSHWPTSSYDLCDAPYDEEIVTTASYDSEQKIWHLDWGAQLNALIDIEDSPLNGDYVTHWMPLPEPPKGE